jgi:hypothetical protein
VLHHGGGLGRPLVGQGGGDLVAGSHDQLRPLAVELAQLEVGLRARLLEQREGSDDRVISPMESRSVRMASGVVVVLSGIKGR